MSTRCYPLYQKGCPQLRVFLPNFWMKLVKPTHKQPENVVQFACSMEMTKHDVKNYLEKIYNVKSVQVRTRIALGPTRRQHQKGYVVKDEDTKYAYVTLLPGETFKFPNLFPEGKDDDTKKEKESLDATKDMYNKFVERNKDRPATPGWFAI